MKVILTDNPSMYFTMGFRMMRHKGKSQVEKIIYVPSLEWKIA